MTDLTTYSTYEEYKAQLDRAITETTQDFVVIGHLLMQARDTDILSSSEYTSMGDFARSEYGLDESVTSRFINIAEKYGDGSGRLKAEYASFTYSKLGEMLTLPSEVAAIVTPDMTVKDIREIKSEVQEEEKISDVEVMIEASQQPDTDILTEFMKAYLENRPDEFIDLGRTEDTEDAYDILAPQGRATLIARVIGTGKIMISIESMEDVKAVYVRENRSEKLTFKNIDDAVSRLFERVPYPDSDDMGEVYSRIYGHDMKQTSPEPVKPEKVKTSKPKPKPKESVPKAPESVSKTEGSVPKAPESVINPEESVQNQAADIMPEPKEEIATSQVSEVMSHYEEILRKAAELQTNLNNVELAAAHQKCLEIKNWLDRAIRFPYSDIKAEFEKNWDKD